jgi:hypothetical protein
VLTAAVAAALGLTGCGGSSHSGSAAASPPPPAPPTSQNQSLDTSQVLMQAKQTSESSSPYPVDDGALTLTDTSETSSPITVNASP